MALPDLHVSSAPEAAARSVGLEAELTVALEAARRAGALQMDRYERLERIVHKSAHDVVTEVDTLSEELIIGAIRAAFPSDVFLAEESGHSGGPKPGGPATTSPSPIVPMPVPADHRIWVIDPLDGTVNYANGIPVFCVSIGLVVGGRPTVAAVYDPARDDLFSAVAGGGAFLNGQPIHHVAKEKMSDAVISLALPHQRFSRREGRIQKAIRVSRVTGSAALALAYVGNGRFDAFIQAAGLSLWDIAAAGLIAIEGGAMITDMAGGAWFDLSRGTRATGIVAAPPIHHAAYLELLR